MGSSWSEVTEMGLASLISVVFSPSGPILEYYRKLCLYRFLPCAFQFIIFYQIHRV